MSQAYTYRTFTVTYDAPPDECVLLVRRTTRRGGISTISGKPRNIYDVRPSGFTDHVILSIAGLRREARRASQE